ncbi:MAG: MCE family protein [Deltaproteobacteria bacterium]|nr:MCE family protein [Deltaproteobacteria bacterium]
MTAPLRSLSVALFALAACTGGDALDVSLNDGAGLAEGTPVEVRGVAVGAVKSVELENGAVRVHAEVESRADLDLRADACAMAGGEPAKLVVLPGESDSPLPAENVLPACSLADLTGDLAEAAGELLQGLGEAIGGSAREAGRKMGETAREVGEGFAEGASGGDLRGTGQSLGMAVRELGDGFAEGAGVDPNTGRPTMQP